MAILDIPIDKLRPGMYLVNIDVSWMHSPFFKHRFMITEQKQVDILKKIGVKVAQIDSDKSVSAEQSEKPIEKQPFAIEQPIKTTSLKDEIDYASKLKIEAKKQLKKAFSVSEDGGKISSEPLSDLVDKSTESMLRNGHGLLSVFHEKVQDADLTNHAFKCMALALLMGQHLDYSDEELNHLGMAALLMDIGWTKLPPKFFRYEYTYTDDEYGQIVEHVDLGIEILEESGIKPEIIHIVTNHHERSDGTGYYLGYTADHIPLSSQILSLVDHYDSQINGYYDSPKVIPATALKEIYRQAQKGAHDTQLCDLLIRMIGIYPLSSAVELNTAEKGVVTKVNWKAPMKPKIKIFYGTHGQPLKKPLEIDMNSQPDGQPKRLIKAVIDPRIVKNDPAGLLVFDI